MTSCFPGGKRRSVSIDTQDGRRPWKVARTDRQDDAAEHFGYSSRDRWNSPSDDIRLRDDSPSPQRDCCSTDQELSPSGCNSRQGFSLGPWEGDTGWKTANGPKQDRSRYSDCRSSHRMYRVSTDREESRDRIFCDRKHHERSRQLGTCEQPGCPDTPLNQHLQSTGRKTSKRRIVPKRSLPPGDYRQYGMAPDTEENQRGRQTAPDSHGQQGTIPRPLADLIEKGKGISLYDVLKVIPLGTQQLKYLLSGVLGPPERSERRQLCEQSGHVECDRSEVDRESTFCDKSGVDSEHMDSQQMRLLHPGTYEQQGMVSNATETQHSQSQQPSLYDKLQDV